MGLVEEGSGVRYLTAKFGALCMKVPADTPKAIENPKKAGEFEKRFKGFEGHIVDIQKTEREWLNPKTNEKEPIKAWEITMVDEHHLVYVVQFAYSSGYSKSFLNRLPNIDLNEQVYLMVGESEDENDPTKKKAWCAAFHGKKKVFPFYTKEEPGKLPPLEVYEENGNTKYNDEKQMAFYEELVESVKPFLKHPNGTFTYPNAVDLLEDSTPDIEKIGAGDPDDLPF